MVLNRGYSLPTTTTDGSTWSDPSNVISLAIPELAIIADNPQPEGEFVFSSTSGGTSWSTNQGASWARYGVWDCQVYSQAIYEFWTTLGFASNELPTRRLGD